MAGVRGSAAPSPITLTGNTGPITLVQAIAPSNHRVILDDIPVSMNGASSSDPPVLFELAVQSNAGSMAALTPKKLNSSDDESLQATFGQAATAEPTTTDVLFRQYIHPMLGDVLRTKGIPVPGGTRVGLRYTAQTLTGTVKCAPDLIFEE